jgi:hypothetical protein
MLKFSLDVVDVGAVNVGLAILAPVSVTVRPEV